MSRACLHSGVVLIAAAVMIAKPAVAADPPGADSGDGGQQPKAVENERDRAERELKQQKRQRILGVIPNFNTSNVSNAAPLSTHQKFRLALRSAVDPFAFVAAGMLAGWEQARNEYPGYGQGAQGYAKRFGAAYADGFSGSMFGGAIFPALLHQDPRYFRKGAGSFRSRFFYALSTAVRAKNDNGRWAPNYSNVFGNIAAGGLSNLYYPAADRGVALTFERAMIVTGEGALGSVFIEFWPDISAKLFHKH